MSWTAGLLYESTGAWGSVKMKPCFWEIGDRDYVKNFVSKLIVSVLVAVMTCSKRVVSVCGRLDVLAEG